MTSSNPFHILVCRQQATQHILLLTGRKVCHAYWPASNKPGHIPCLQATHRTNCLACKQQASWHMLCLYTTSPPQFTSKCHLLFWPVSSKPQHIVAYRQHAYHSPGLQAASLSTQSFLAHNTARLQRLLRGFVCVDRPRTRVFTPISLDTVAPTS